MNKSLVLGFFSVNAVFFTTVFLALGSLRAVYDIDSIVIVIGGTITVSFFCFSFSDIKKLFGDSRRAIFKNENPLSDNTIIEDIITLAKAKRKSDKEFMSASQSVDELFLREASKALFWVDAETSVDDFRNLLEIKSMTYFEDESKSPTLLKALSKFPPAFGLMGTVLGIVSMLTKMSDPNAKSQLGASMAIAMMTTLYGIGLNNLLILPLAEHLTRLSKQRRKTFDIIIEGVLMIQAKKPVNYIKEKLQSFLTIDQKAKLET